MPLTPRQRKFIAVYAGNGTEAARLAGYNGSDNVLAQVARENLRKPQIALALKEREAKEVRPLIADRQERQALWTRAMRGEEEVGPDRLKAAELLGRSEADFTDNLKHTGDLRVVFNMWRAKP